MALKAKSEKPNSVYIVLDSSGDIVLRGEFKNEHEVLQEMIGYELVGHDEENEYEICKLVKRGSFETRFVEK
jgi:hypothetical protein